MAAESQILVLGDTRDRDVAVLFDQWRKPLLRYLICSGASRDEGMDIVQDTFLRLHQHLSNGGARDNLKAWVFRVAHNAAINGRMRAERRLSAVQSEAAGVDRMAAPGDDPERLLLKKDRLRRLHAAMKELTAAELGCVLLRAEGLRYREIAGVLDIGVTTVADCLDRALRKLGEKCNV